MNRENWEVKKLGEVCEITNGRNQKKVVDPNGIYPIMGSGGIMGYANDFLCPIDTVIIGRKGTINKPLFVKDNVWIVDTAFGIVANNSILNSSFLFYFCKFFDFNKLNVAVTIPSLRKIDLKEIPILIPPLPIQEAIVKELDTLHRLKELQEQQLTEYDNLAQSTFYSMFGDPIENDRGWEVKKLGEVCDITSSKRIFADEYKRHGIPFYRSKEIIEKGNKANISIELFISKERYSDVKDSFGVPKIGDILMTAVGTIGETWVVDTNDPFYFKDGNIVWLKMNKSTNSTFFKFALTKLVNEYKKKMSIGSAYSALTIISLKNMQVILPPLPLQSQFADHIEKIEKQKELVKQSIAQTQMLIDYTMDKYFN